MFHYHPQIRWGLQSVRNDWAGNHSQLVIPSQLSLYDHSLRKRQTLVPLVLDSNQLRKPVVALT
jgi:hypothetical protein